MASREEPLRTLELVHNGADSPIHRLNHDHEEANGVKDNYRKMDEEVHDAELVIKELSMSSRASSIEEPSDNDKGDDQGDAFGFGKGSVSASALPGRGGPAAAMPVAKDAECYNMSHRRRGLAFVFNHKNFDTRLGLKQRNGTDADRDNLRFTLQALDFDVRVYEDLKCKDIDRILEAAATTEDHRDADCILIAVLSHGEMGILYASDHAYKPDRLWTQFNAEACPSLAGKPKLFFIQACQGDQLDGGVRLEPVTQTDSASAMSYKIPTHADFLIVYSTIPGFYSWRNTTAGSWFVQALCHVLQRKGQEKDLLSLLTHVSRKVAFDFQSNTPGDFMMHEKKQIPCITSMLTRDVFFRPKIQRP